MVRKAARRDVVFWKLLRVDAIQIHSSVCTVTWTRASAAVDLMLRQNALL